MPKNRSSSRAAARAANSQSRHSGRSQDLSRLSTRNVYDPKKETWGETLFGKDPKILSVPNYEGQQYDYASEILNRARQGLPSGEMDYYNHPASGFRDLAKKGYSPFEGQDLMNATSEQIAQMIQGGFDPIRQSANRNFENYTTPSVLNRLTSLGANRNDSAVGSQLAQAGGLMNQELGSLEAQYNQNALGQLQSFYNSLQGGKLSDRGQQQNLQEILAKLKLGHNADQWARYSPLFNFAAQPYRTTSVVGGKGGVASNILGGLAQGAGAYAAGGLPGLAAAGANWYSNLGSNKQNPTP